MAEDKSGQRKGTGSRRPERKRPVIDLKAEEVKAAPGDTSGTAGKTAAETSTDKGRGQATAVPPTATASASGAAGSKDTKTAAARSETSKAGTSKAETSRSTASASPATRTGTAGTAAKDDSGKTAKPSTGSQGRTKPESASQSKSRTSAGSKPPGRTASTGGGTGGSGRSGGGGGSSTQPPSKKGGRGWGVVSVLVALLVAIVAGAVLYRTYGGSLFPFIGAPTDRLTTLEQTLKQNSQKLWTVGQQLEETRNRLDGVARDVSTARGEAQLARTNLEKAQQDAARALATVNELRDSLKAAEAGGNGGGTGGGTADTASAERLASLAGTLETLSTRVDGLASEVEAARAAGQQASALAERVSALESALQTMKAERSAQARAAAGLAGALDGLRRAIAEGRPYGEELDAVTAALPGADIPPALTDNADKGVATRAELASAFAKVTESLSTPATPPPSPDTAEGLWERLVARLSSVVQVRSSDRADWPGIARRMARLADAGDLAGAVKLADAAGSEPPAALADWLSRARARIAVESAMDQITDRALARLSAPASQTAE